MINYCNYDFPEENMTVSLFDNVYLYMYFYETLFPEIGSEVLYMFNYSTDEELIVLYL